MGTSSISRAQIARTVVTGAGSGIGRAFALEAASRGGRVVCSDHRGDTAEETVAMIRRQGGEAQAVTCDVTQAGDVAALATAATAWFGRAPSLVINNAGVALGGQRLEDISLDDWRWILDVNVWGVIHGCKVFVPLLREAGEGCVLNVASAASFGSAPLMGAYNVSKAAVVSLTETLHAELAGSGVQASVLCPTFVHTNILRNGRLAAGLGATAQRLMDRTGMPADELVQRTLDAIARGQIHVLPQTDARVSWWAKRMMPGVFTRLSGVAGRRVAAGRATR